MRLKEKKEQRTVEPSRFALGIPAMDARNDALASHKHVRAGVNTGDLDLVSMTNGDYINSRIGGHTSTFSKEQLNNILHATPSVPGETGKANEPPVELEGPVKDGEEMPTEIITDNGKLVTDPLTGERGVMPRSLPRPPVKTVAELNTALKDFTGAVSSKDVYYRVGDLYRYSNTGVSLKQSRNGAEIMVGDVPLADATVANLEMAIGIMKQLKDGAEGKGKERIASDLRKLKRTLKSKAASKPSSASEAPSSSETPSSSEEGDDEGESKTESEPAKKVRVKLKSKKAGSGQ